MLIIPAGMPLHRQYVRPVFRAAEVYRPVTKWSALAHNVQELPDLMRRAFHAMRSGKGGPVMVEIPDEVFEAEFNGALDYVPVPVQRVAPDPEAVRTAVQMLLAAKNPLILAGQGVHYAEAGERLAALAELLPAPVATTNPGKSAIPESHPLSLGASTRSRPKMFTDFMAKADVVLAIGTSLTRTPFGPGVPPGKTIIHSSNDAGDVNKEYRVDLAVIGDAALTLDALIAEASRQKGPGGGNALASLTEEVAAAKKAWLGEWAKFLDSDETPLNQYRVIRDLMRTVDRDNVIMTHDFRQPARADDAVLGDHDGGLLHGLGQVHAAGLWPRHHHGRQARGAEQALRQRDGRFRHRHDRHGHRDGGAQPHRHPHRGVQQRRDGRRARRAADLGRQIRHDGGGRQLLKGGRGAQRRRRAVWKKPADIVSGDQGGGLQSPNPARRSCWSSWSRKAATSRAIHWRGCRKILFPTGACG